ncbi:response regulator [Paenibacillus sp.]|uniref:response regulator transcription factor n=1 Tax=Paenibacillus sp. TaxID=58172 RepID=UPI002811B3D3|nr:response regulator [Paenibacillus sp.]
MSTERRYAVTVVVAEDEELIRGSLVRKIEGVDASIGVVAAAQDGKEALEAVERWQPDLVVTDIRMPVMDGIELIKSLHLYHPRVRKIIATGYADFEYAREAMRYNVSEYLLKPTSAKDLSAVLLRLKTAIEGQREAEDGQLRALPRAAGDSPDDIVRAVCDYMRVHFNKELSLEQIARHFNFNASYLSKIFVKHTGEPPSRYLMSLRINEAKYLLSQHRSLSVKEVGERVGYPDQFYFSRVFKQAAGMTPKEFQSSRAQE